MDGFAHLHVHSQYSLLDGTIRMEELMQAVREGGMNAVALTDHGNLFGAVDFHDAAVEGGVKPILGMEAYISPTTRRDRSMGRIETASYHLILLAMNQTGWRNLMKLSSRGYLEGFYYRPRIDRELLSELNEGLICTTACLGGEVPTALLSHQPTLARKIAGEYRDIFGSERFFIEVQDQNLPDQQATNAQLIALAEELGVGLVATNDVHFLRRQDKPAHEVLTCISTGKTLADGGALDYSPELYLKSAAEMRASLGRLPPSAADNTLRIAEMCDLRLDFSARHLPHFATPDGRPAEQYLRDLARKGLSDRFDGHVPEEYGRRLEWELKVIAEKGYSSYFLIVNDFVQFARSQGIPAAPRGSGVATLLGWSLGIADVDPLTYGLLFERFTDPQREEAPDMDIDICQEGRAKVLEYVRSKYGHVAQIITYGTLKARAVLRDVGRVLGVPLAEVDAICKLVPEGLKVTLDSALSSEPELRRRYDAETVVRDMIDFGRRLEGLTRHSGVHAAGVIVAQTPLENLVPLYRQSDNPDPITQWDGVTCADKVGLMKMDFLGLRTLTILQRARELVRRKTGKDLDPEKLPLDDQKVFEIFRAGQTDGIFQFESEGMKNILVQIQPTRIEELIAANAMYRPGPMELIPSYVARKHRREPIPSVHPLVDDILAETYGIMVYQEQVMLVLNRLGKLPLNRALTLIKAISKKKQGVIEAERPNFLAGAAENGIAASEAQRLFELILKFAGYGFNKAHSTRYAIVAFQTACFKAHYPREFLAATLTYECADTDRVAHYLEEAERMGINVAPPDINACDSEFTVDGPQVRFGLSAVKGVGAKAVEAIVEARSRKGRFSDLYDFCRHVDLRCCNKAVIEALIKCGAFDALGASRAQMVAALDQSIELGQVAASDRASGQMNLFGADKDRPAVRFPDVEPWSDSQLLAAEKETLGFYVSSHPLVRHAREIRALSWPKGVSAGSLERHGENTPVTVGCMISGVRKTVTRAKQEPMAILTVEDETGRCEAVVFPRAYATLSGLLKADTIVFLVGKLARSRDKPNIVVDDVIPMDEALERLSAKLYLRLAPGTDLGPVQERLRAVLAEHRGSCPVVLRLTPPTAPEVYADVRLGTDWQVRPSGALLEALTELLGDQKHVWLEGKGANGANGGNVRPASCFATRRASAQRELLHVPKRETPPPREEVSPAVTRFN